MTQAQLLVGTLEDACVFLIVAYVFTRFRFFDSILEGKPAIGGRIALIVVFGALAIYGTYSGTRTAGAIANIRDVAPMLAGFMGGPWVGLGAGLIGGIHRYFQGGFTAIPCGLATVIAGVAAGLLFWGLKGRLGFWKPTLLALGLGAFDMLLILMISRPFSDAVHLVSIIAMPMIVGATICVALYTVMLRGIRKEISAGEFG